VRVGPLKWHINGGGGDEQGTSYQKKQKVAGLGKESTRFVGYICRVERKYENERGA